MSEEEKEAIEYWKKWLTLFHLNTQLASEHYLQVLLNLIEKQQKEIENSVSKDKIRELRDIDNIDLIQYKLKKLLEEII